MLINACIASFEEYRLGIFLLFSGGLAAIMPALKSEIVLSLDALLEKAAYKIHREEEINEALNNLFKNGDFLKKSDSHKSLIVIGEPDDNVNDEITDEFINNNNNKTEKQLINKNNNLISDEELQKLVSDKIASSIQLHGYTLIPNNLGIAEEAEIYEQLVHAYFKGMLIFILKKYTSLNVDEIYDTSIEGKIIEQQRNKKRVIFDIIKEEYLLSYLQYVNTHTKLCCNSFVRKMEEKLAGYVPKLDQLVKEMQNRTCGCLPVRMKKVKIGA